MGSTRRPPHRRNEDLERLLNEINTLLEPAEEKITADYEKPKYPVVFVVGAPRSGTTLLMQLLATTGRFAYPTNLLSRFYAAPYIGAKIQLLLTSPKYNFNDELVGFDNEISLTSLLGKTQGPLAPNEFWYFWRRFIPNTTPRNLSAEEQEKIDGAGFAAELAALESVFNKPIAMKGIILQYNLPTLSTFFDKALFLHIKRDPFYNTQSLLESREEYYGDRNTWWSVEPREYDALKNQDPFTQVAGQVYYTNRAIEESLAKMETGRSLTVSYEALCQDPATVYHEIAGRLADQDCDIDRSYVGPKQLKDTNQVRLTPEDCAAIKDAYRKISGKPLET